MRPFLLPNPQSVYPTGPQDRLLGVPTAMSEGQGPAAPPPAGPRNSNSSGGRRRAGRGASHHSDRSENRREDGTSDSQPRGPKSRGGGGGGRGGRDRQRNRSQKPKAQASNAASGGGGQPPGSVPDGPGTSGDRSTGDARRTESEGKGKQLVATATDEPDDGEICFICASKVEHTSVAPCNHRTCHICALRLRALYKTKACAHCRVCPSSNSPVAGHWLTRCHLRPSPVS